ncbi:coenzyme F420 hydrogenase subunit beta [Mycobacterium sp. OAS707]|nr:coenzyme F420 hydrogenase subunit beta [Mycobacterium sp. OAS707]
MTGRDELEERIAHVVRRADTCSGCGACSHVSSRVTLALDERGHLRPRVSCPPATAAEAREERHQFDAICPGLRLEAPDLAKLKHHKVFGGYVSAWEGQASDAQIRFAGGSAGVLTALTLWMIDSGIAKGAVGVAPDADESRRTVSVSVMKREEALRSAGSRYAPVSTLAAYDVTGRDVYVGRPCEAGALRQLQDYRLVPAGDRPPSLSFFCAGVPSQAATDDLIRSFGTEPAKARILRYRGNGWPGDFTFEDECGNAKRLSYEKSWGEHLGRDLPWRCKLCPDGTGASADIAVGDFWEADERGFPTFSDRDGTSVVIARTERGHNWLLRAASEGVLHLSSIDLDGVARVQPLQTERKRTLVVRLIGRVLAGRPVPSYHGYHLVASTTLNPKKLAKAFLGTLERSLFKARYRTPEL